MEPYESEPFNNNIYIQVDDYNKEITGVEDVDTTKNTTLEQLPQHKQSRTQMWILATQTKSKEWGTITQHVTSTQKIMKIGTLN